MIKYIEVKGTYKTNWLDDRGVLVGFDVTSQCCEVFGYRVYEKESGKHVFDDPDGLPYHFAKTYETNTKMGRTGIVREYCGDEAADLFQVDMLPDDGKGPVLVFECYNHHNGYYYHDFSMTVDFKESGVKG